MKAIFEKKKFSGRRLARVFVLEILYRYELLSENPEKIYLEILNRENPSQEIRDFIRKVLDGVINNITEIDALISNKSKNWEIDRITPIDKALMRIAIAEMLSIPDVPYKVSITEAIELAKIFSTEDSSKFVNGILDAIADELGFKGNK